VVCKSGVGRVCLFPGWNGKIREEYFSLCKRASGRARRVLCVGIWHWCSVSFKLTFCTEDTECGTENCGGNQEHQREKEKIYDILPVEQLPREGGKRKIERGREMEDQQRARAGKRGEKSDRWPRIVLYTLRSIFARQSTTKKRALPHTHASFASTKVHLRYVTAVEQYVVQTALEILPGGPPVPVACCLNLCFPSLHCSSLFPSKEKEHLPLQRRRRKRSCLHRRGTSCSCRPARLHKCARSPQFLPRPPGGLRRGCYSKFDVEKQKSK
jgi:hypothetical protein